MLKYAKLTKILAARPLQIQGAKSQILKDVEERCRALHRFVLMGKNILRHFFHKLFDLIIKRSTDC